MGYSGDVNTLPDLIPKHLSLLILDERSRRLLPALIARLALRAPLRVLDGGNCFPAYPVAREIRRQTPDLDATLERIQVARAFTCYQALALLEETPANSTQVLILSLLSTFYDESVRIAERKRLLNRCTQEIRRLCRQAPVGVIVPLRPAQPNDPDLLQILERLADGVWRFEDERPLPPPRLF
jgi:hypothetical protein